MIRTCMECGNKYNDEFRYTTCPHETFPANDGQNVFSHHVDSMGPDTEGNPCPKCGSQLYSGFGLMGGGYGPYESCNNCGFLNKVCLGDDEA